MANESTKLTGSSEHVESSEFIANSEPAECSEHTSDTAIQLKQPKTY